MGVRLKNGIACLLCKQWREAQNVLSEFNSVRCSNTIVLYIHMTCIYLTKYYMQGGGGGCLESGVGSTTAHGNHTWWFDLGFGCFQLWIWLCVILPYVIFEWKQVKTGLWWCRKWLFWVAFLYFQLWMFNYCGIIVESKIKLTVYALDGLIFGLCAGTKVTEIRTHNFKC